jgi:hypothetical protein
MCVSFWHMYALVNSKLIASKMLETKMNKQLLWRTVWLVIASVAMLAGCSTTVRTTKKLEGYTQKLSDAGVVWQNNPQLKFQIRKTAHPSIAAITEANKNESRENLSQMMRLLESKSTYAISAQLNSNAIRATSLANNTSYFPNGTQHLIKVYADFAGSECSGLNCSHDLGLIVNVVDVALNKTVWSGGFKVGPPLGSPVTDQLIDSFTASLISELKGAKLL